jgi:hypothetical protein
MRGESIALWARCLREPAFALAVGRDFLARFRLEGTWDVSSARTICFARKQERMMGD